MRGGRPLRRRRRGGGASRMLSARFCAGWGVRRGRGRGPISGLKKKKKRAEILSNSFYLLIPLYHTQKREYVLYVLLYYLDTIWDTIHSL